MQNDLDAFEHVLERRLRLVTFNIRHGEMGLDKVAQVLQDLSPDVVLLQEVDLDCRRSGNVDQTRILAQGLGLHGCFAEAIPLEGGSYGLAILSRLPLGPEQILRLPQPFEHTGNGHGEPRIALFVEVRNGEKQGGLVLGCTHLGLDPNERLQQAQALRSVLGTTFAGRPVLLGGDLNEGRNGQVLATLGDQMEDAFAAAGGTELESAPEDRPRTRIDFVLRSTEAPFPVAAFVGPEGASDHRPVVVDFAAGAEWAE